MMRYERACRLREMLSAISADAAEARCQRRDAESEKMRARERYGHAAPRIDGCARSCAAAVAYAAAAARVRA